MKKFISLSLLSLIVSTNTFAQKKIDPDEIVRKADLKRGLGNISHSFKVAITNKDNKKETFLVYFKDVNTSLTEQIEPERARGRKLLMNDYDMWLFTKNTKKPIRISLEQKLTGEVSNGDIARTNYAEDYAATLLDSKGDSYRLELKAKNKKVTYGRIEYLVKKKDFIPAEATFFAVSGKPLKKAVFSGFKKIDGVDRSTIMTITDHIQKDRVSVMEFSDHKRENFKESMFNKDRMEF